MRRLRPVRRSPPSGRRRGRPCTTRTRPPEESTWAQAPCRGRAPRGRTRARTGVEEVGRLRFEADAGGRGVGALEQGPRIDHLAEVPNQPVAFQPQGEALQALPDDVVVVASGRVARDAGPILRCEGAAGVSETDDEDRPSPGQVALRRRDPRLERAQILHRAVTPGGEPRAELVGPLGGCRRSQAREIEAGGERALQDQLGRDHRRHDARRPHAPQAPGFRLGARGKLEAPGSVDRNSTLECASQVLRARRFPRDLCRITDVPEKKPFRPGYLPSAPI